jgi:hypothetical protein
METGQSYNLPYLFLADSDGRDDPPRRFGGRVRDEQYDESDRGSGIGPESAYPEGDSVIQMSAIQSIYVCGSPPHFHFGNDSLGAGVHLDSRAADVLWKGSYETGTGDHRFPPNLDDESDYIIYRLCKTDVPG